MYVALRSLLLRLPAALGLLVLLASAASARPFEWELPEGFPRPRVPEDNPMTWEKVELGRFLFYDARLSGNGTQSCASCHEQARAFSDGLTLGIGSTGEVHPRNSMALINIAYVPTLAWANPLLDSLERQIPIPMFGEAPVELGLAGREDDLIARLRADRRYQRMFREAFPGDDDPTSVGNVVRSIAAFVRTLISGNSPADRYRLGLDDNAISESAKRGLDLFFEEKFDCFHCHGGFNFSDSVVTAESEFIESPFHNNHLYNIGGTGAYPPNNTGVFSITDRPEDMGFFRAPTLRNLVYTAPYMHDGSIATLEEVLDHYAAGGREITEGPYAGDGSKTPEILRSEFIRGFKPGERETQDMLAFLRALTDEDFVTNPRFADPFVAPACGGDCGLDGAVTVDEILAGIGIALGEATLSDCLAIDRSGDGEVTVDEILQSVQAALGGCPS